MKCPDCAQVRRPPMYDVSGKWLWRSVGAAVGLVLAGGFVFSLIVGMFGRSLIFAALLYLLAGVAIPEALSAAANRKRGPRLQALAVVTVVLVTQFSLIASLVLSGRLAPNVITLLLSAVAAAIAWNRLR